MISQEFSIWAIVYENKTRDIPQIKIKNIHYRWKYNQGEV